MRKTESASVVNRSRLIEALATGELSVEEFAQLRRGAGRGQAESRAAGRVFGMGAEGPQKQVRGAQVASALNKLQEARYRGVLSRGETDRAADEMVAQAPNVDLDARLEPKTPRQPLAEAIVRKYVLFTSGAGLISVGLPGVGFTGVIDLLLIPVLQLRMLQSLGSLYGVSFTEEWGKNIIATLVGTVTSRSLATRTLPIVGIFAAPASNAAATYALGTVFITHFESGGTLLNFSPEKLKGYFADYFNSPSPSVTMAS
jgi:uncharacterized protein (DUF697 family)